MASPTPKATPKPTPKKTTMSSPTPDPYAVGFKGSSSFGATADPVAQSIYKSTDAQRKKLADLLAKAGFRVPTTGAKATSVALADAYIQATQMNSTENARLGITRTTEEWLKENIKPTVIATGTPNLPSRSIYQYTPEQLGAKIDDIAQSLLGRIITAEDKQAKWYKDLNKTLNNMVAKGTVTTTKQVKNKKTGKLETVTIQKPEVTSEGLEQTITSALSAADPISLERKKNLEFANWAFGKMGGNQ